MILLSLKVLLTTLALVTLVPFTIIPLAPDTVVPFIPLSKTTVPLTTLSKSGGPVPFIPQPLSTHLLSRDEKGIEMLELEKRSKFASPVALITPRESRRDAGMGVQSSNEDQYKYPPASSAQSPFSVTILSILLAVPLGAKSMRVPITYWCVLLATMSSVKVPHRTGSWRER
ncbi:hypothetical protein HYALB_00014018 [Hymenoscyphus albidus]|uniref:Uncharacterized protein n=1 Tax=Hymenoscyphus albidus TaxID=595503 RepID=A0A9N9QB99_9HELO|nr:hypothetical protein HYALB_00014018 [Hymenoscyphus albidus]